MNLCVVTHQIDEYLKNYHVLVCSLRNSRIKAKKIAIMEMFNSLFPLKGIFISNGPLGDVKGLFSFFILKEYKIELKKYLKQIGYCDKFYMLDFENPEYKNTSEINSVNGFFWKKKKFSIQLFYEQSDEIYKNQSPHNRKFLIIGKDRCVKEVFGYRGDGSERGRRGLPVEDARCLVNLATPSILKTLIDPFAGGGGIVYQAKYIKEEIDVISIDIDPTLEPGLTFYGAKHYVSNSCTIQLGNTQIDAIVTEVPFSNEATTDIIMTLKNISKYLNNNGKVIIMSSIQQAEKIKYCINELGLFPIMSYQLNRKGTDVVIMTYTKSQVYYEMEKEILNVVKYIY